MKKNILISMLGSNDCKLDQEDTGAIIGILRESEVKINTKFSKVIILLDENGEVRNRKGEMIRKYSDSKHEIAKYFAENFPKIELIFKNIKIVNPIDYSEVYPTMFNFVRKFNTSYKEENYYISITSGTSTMSASWILLVKSGYINATIVQTSPQKGLNTVDLEISNFPEIKKLEDAKIEINQLKIENEYLKKLKLNIEIPKIIGNSQQIENVKKQIELLAKHDIPVMILGATGTGKELVAKALHNHSNRKDSKFIAVNCGAISENLVESELFGYVKGAFSGATKNTDGIFTKVGDGTLFLDEIGDLPLFMQVKLLRVLNEKTFSPVGNLAEEKKSKARIVAATNRNIWQLMKEGKFREDLFFRLTDEIITLPTLQERGSKDIQEISEYLLEKLNNEQNNSLSFSEESIQKLSIYDWPGNIRELGQVIRRAFIYSDSIITEFDIRFIPSTLENEKTEIKIPPEGLNFETDVEVKYYVKALELADGNITKAAKLLGFSKMHTFRKRLESKRINAKDFKKYQ